MATILIVDDAPSIVELLRQYLQRDGFIVEHATDGEEALDAVRRVRPDLVVLDLMLPRLSGWEVCRRRIRAAGSTPVIGLTVQDGDADRRRGSN